MKEKAKRGRAKYQKPAIVAMDKGRITYGCPQSDEKTCGVGYRK